MRTSKRYALLKSNKNLMRGMVVILSVLIALTGVTTLFIREVFAESKPAISADSAIVVSASTGEVVYTLHEDRKLSQGGFVKYMVAMVAIDQMHDSSEYDNKIKITDKVDSLGKLFNKGEKVTVRDLMASLIIQDSDEAALALAIYSSGNRGKFIKAMNSKAQELGLLNTHYTNVTGKEATLQYSTAEDTAMLMQQAMKYSFIKKYMAKDAYAMESTDVKTTSLHRKDTLQCTGLTFSAQLQSSSGGRYNSFAVADREGMKLIAIVFGDGTGKNDVRKTLLEYGYRNVTYQSIVKKGKAVGKIKIRHGAKTRVSVYTESKGYVYVPKEGSDSLIRTETVIYDKLKAPVKAGTKAGEYQIYVADQLTGTVDLVVKEDVAVGWFPSYIYISNTMSIIILVVVLLILALIIRILQIRRRNRLRRERRRQQRIREIALKEYEREQDRKRRNWTYH